MGPGMVAVGVGFVGRALCLYWQRGLGGLRRGACRSAGAMLGQCRVPSRCAVAGELDGDTLGCLFEGTMSPAGPWRAVAFPLPVLQYSFSIHKLLLLSLNW